jgi:hypothetical protein
MLTREGRAARCGEARRAPAGRGQTAGPARDSRTAGHDGDEARNVAAGNAVLAAIAPSDALTCLRLGRHSRGRRHQEPAALLRAIRPDGTRRAKDLTVAVGAKDAAHDGSVFFPTVLRSTLRAATRLVEAAETAVAT